MYQRWGANLLGGQRQGFGYHSATRWPVLDYVFGSGATTLAEAQHNFAPITFSRTSLAMLTDASGTLVFAPHNLILQSEVLGTTWVLAGANIPTLSSNASAAPDGNTTADQLTFGALEDSRCEQIVTANTSASTQYIFTIYAKVASGTDTFRLGIFDNGTGGNQFSSDLTATTAWQRFDLTATFGDGAARSLFIRNNAAGGAGAILFWGAQLNQGPLQSYNPTTTAAFHGPRFDHDPVSGEPLGLLIEEARTNVCLQSEVLTTTWAPTGTPVIVSNALVAPDGNTTMDTVEDNASSGNIEFVKQSITVANDSTSWVLSIFIPKTTSASHFPGMTIRVTGGTDIRGDFTLNTDDGTMTERAGFAGASANGIIDVGDFWRLWVAITNDSTGNTSMTVDLLPAINTDAGDTWFTTTTGTTGFWGVQVENAIFPTSYIKTTTAAVARTVDVLTMSDVSWLNQSVGTFLIKGRQETLTGAVGVLIQIDDGGSTDRLVVSLSMASTASLNTINSGGINGESISGSAISAATSFKIIGAYAQDDVIVGLDGTLDASPDTTADLPLTDTLTTARIGDSSTGSMPLNGHIARITYWNRRFPNEFLQSITS